MLYALLLALLYVPVDCAFFPWGGLPMLAYSYVVGCFALLAGSVPLRTRRWPLTLFLMAVFSLPLPFLANFGWPRGEFRSLAALVGVRAALFVLATALGWWVIRRVQRRARIAAERRGIAEMEATLAKLPLGVIERVEFYKRDELTTDLVCCDVTTNEKPPQVWFFHEEMPGWKRLLLHLEQLLGFAKDWRRHVIQPPFAESRFVAFAAGDAAKPGPMAHSAPPQLDLVPPSIQVVVAAAKALGYEVAAVAPWSGGLVVHMRGCLTEEHRATLRSQFKSLEYFVTEGSPHTPPDEGFIDRDAGAAISFPRDAARPW